MVYGYIVCDYIAKVRLASVTSHCRPRCNVKRCVLDMARTCKSWTGDFHCYFAKARKCDV